MREIRSHVISGNVKKSDSLTRLVTEAGQVKLVYHNESIPNVKFPFDLGKEAIERQIRKQFEQMREMMKSMNKMPMGRMMPGMKR